jgi:hypothetical protein
MSRIVKVTQGDYRVQVVNGGDLVLGATLPGNVIILGDLDVRGTTTTIESTNLVAGINLFSINTGLLTPGIPSSLNYQSGLSVGRGTYNTAQLLFDDSVTHYDPTTTLTATTVSGSGSVVTMNFATQSATPFLSGTTIVVKGFSPATYDGTYTVLASPTPTTSSVSFTSSVTSAVTVYGTITANVKGTWLLRTANTTAIPATNSVLSGLQLRTITSDGSNTLVIDLQRGSPTLRLANSTTSGAVPYYQRVLDKDDIPNVEWVQTYIASNYVLGTTTPGTATVQTIQQPVGVAIGSANSAIQATSGGLLFQIGGSTIAQVTSTGMALGNLAVGAIASPNEINNSTTNNLVLSANTNNVEITGALNLDNQISSVTATAATATGGIATITFASQLTKPFGVGSTITLSGFTPAQTSGTVNNVNTSFTVTVCTLTTVQFAITGTYTGSVMGTVAQSIASTSNKTKIYSSGTIGPGRTGVYVTNSTVTTPDELISRNRAVLLSILL